MADVEFEPLHGENEEEAEFILGGKKKETPAKKHRQKGGQLFPRKSVEKKDKTVVIDNSKAFGATPTPIKSGHFQHHYHPRTVEGLVGPGDIQFSSSPPNYDDDSVVQNDLSQSTGSIPMSVNQNQQNPVQRQLHLPLRPPHPPTWAQASQPTPTKLQQRTLSQERLTLLEQSNYVVSPSKTQSPRASTVDGMKTPDRFDEHRTIQTPSFQAQIGSKTPPRVASPTEGSNFSPPSQIHPNAPVGRKFERSESWGPSTHTELVGREENWADFSKSFDGTLSADEDEFESKRRRQSQVSTISEGSEGSYVSEIDDSVWKITEEQRNYYVTQFKKMQPNEKGLIKGPQARDFFLKSNLPVEVLSKIWHLSDINKDSALDIEEFCIAMHLVVAVKHEVELPMVLPAIMMPSKKAESFEASFPSASDDVAPSSNRVNGSLEEERPQSPQNQPPDDQRWAKFEVVGSSTKQDSSKEDQTFQAPKPTAPKVVEDNTESRSHADDKFADTGNEKDRVVEETKPASLSSTESSTSKLQRTQTPQDIRPNLEETSSIPQSPVVKDGLAKKTSIGIARPRGIGPAINLMDAAPGQLLPPPDSRKNRKMAQQVQPEPAGRLSPPISPDSRFSNQVSSDFQLLGKDFAHADSDDKLQQKKAELNEKISKAGVDVEAVAKESKESKKVLDNSDGFEPPKLIPRRNQSNSEETAAEWQQPEAFVRRSSSVRRGERPRSYTADSRSSKESLVEALPIVDSKDFPVPPTPPPRKMKSHKRGSSLDLNKIFSRSQQNLAGAREIVERKIDITDALPPRIPRIDSKEEKQEKKERGDIQGIARPRPAPKNHRRSVSHDTAKPLTPLAPPPKTAEGIIKDTSASGHRKKPAPPKPSAATRYGRSKSLERTIESTGSEETNSFDKKPRHLCRPLRQKRQKHEIQAEIRQLRYKNASIASLNGELHHELREAMESRTVLETKLTKMKQSFE